MTLTTVALSLGILFSGIGSKTYPIPTVASAITKEYGISKQEATIAARSINRYAERYKVPVALVLSMSRHESAFERNVVSPKGAIGVMQMMPSTAVFVAKRLGVKEYDLTDIKTNIRFGTWYLRHLYDMFGDWGLAVRAYNAGPARVKRVLAKKSRDYPAETIAYHDNVFALAYNIMMVQEFTLRQSNI